MSDEYYLDAIKEKYQCDTALAQKILESMRLNDNEPELDDMVESLRYESD